MPCYAATAGTGRISPGGGSLLPCIARVALRAARNSALAAYQAPPYDATAIAHEAACRINAVCVQLAHVLAW